MLGCNELFMDPCIGRVRELKLKSEQGGRLAGKQLRQEGLLDLDGARTGPYEENTSIPSHRRLSEWLTTPRYDRHRIASVLLKIVRHCAILNAWQRWIYRARRGIVQPPYKAPNVLYVELPRFRRR